MFLKGFFSCKIVWLPIFWLFRPYWPRSWNNLPQKLRETMLLKACWNTTFSARPILCNFLSVHVNFVGFFFILFFVWPFWHILCCLHRNALYKCNLLLLLLHFFQSIDLPVTVGRTSLGSLMTSSPLPRSGSTEFRQFLLDLWKKSRLRLRSGQIRSSSRIRWPLWNGQGQTEQISNICNSSSIISTLNDPSCNFGWQGERPPLNQPIQVFCF